MQGLARWSHAAWSRVSIILLPWLHGKTYLQCGCGSSAILRSRAARASVNSCILACPLMPCQSIDQSINHNIRAFCWVCPGIVCILGHTWCDALCTMRMPSSLDQAAEQLRSAAVILKPAGGWQQAMFARVSDRRTCSLAQWNTCRLR